jgi:uncharacterized protein YcbK (DUF882 family)
MLASRWFHEAEFASHDGVQYPVEWAERLQALCSQLDVIRGAWGGPLRVVSGYRTPAHNAAVGGAQASQHMEGRAADIAPFARADVMAEQCLDLHARILRLLSEQKLPLVGGLGVYKGWVHVDIRPKPPDGHIARWVGTGIGSEVA